MKTVLKAFVVFVLYASASIVKEFNIMLSNYDVWAERIG